MDNRCSTRCEVHQTARKALECIPETAKWNEIPHTTVERLFNELKKFPPKRHFQTVFVSVHAITTHKEITLNSVVLRYQEPLMTYPCCRIHWIEHFVWGHVLNFSCSPLKYRSAIKKNGCQSWNASSGTLIATEDEPVAVARVCHSRDWHFIFENTKRIISQTIRQYMNDKVGPRKA